jgi:hypothetical protein
MAETPCFFSSPPHRNAAKTSASARTDIGRGTVRSIPYTARASVIMSAAHCASASDLVLYTEPSRLTDPSFSPWTGEWRGCAWHCIQSHAARSFQLIPAWLATSRYSCSVRASGILALVK